MLDIISNRLRRLGINPDKAHLPKHIAFSIGGVRAFIKRRDPSFQYQKMFGKISDIIKFQVTYDVPVTTLYLLTSKVHEALNFQVIVDELTNAINELSVNELIHKNKIKVSILGKWYDLPSRAIDPIKKILDETKDYDSFFLNLCINYDGKEEIIDSCKIIARKLLAEKLDVDAIDEEMIKESLYSSYFLPPDLIVKTGKEKKLNGFLLWDSTQSVIYFSNILWPDLKEKDFIHAIKYYQHNR